MALDIRKPKGKGANVRILNVRDFTGGLNLTSDVFKLQPNESPDMLNVDIDRRGGIQLRSGVAPYRVETLASTPRSMFPIEVVDFGAPPNKYRWLVANVGSTFQFSFENGAWADNPWGGAVPAPLTGAFTGPAHVAHMNNSAYIIRGHDQPATIILFGGALPMSASGPTWQDSYASPGSTSYMPKAKFIAAHMGYMFVANTKENTATFGNRVRFSHPLRATFWRANDYIDVIEDTWGDEITGLMPFQDHLLVFKNRSVWAIHGYDTGSFQLVKVASDIGAPSQEAIVSTPMGVFFFDQKRGVHVYNGQQPVWAFTSLYPAIVDQRLDRNDLNKVNLGWSQGRLFCSVPWEDANLNRTFVLDPNMGEGDQGAWTAYDMGLGPFAISPMPPNETVSSVIGTNTVQVLDIEDNPYDIFVGTTEVPIESHYRTVWQDLGEPRLRKRWRRLEMVVQGGAEQTLHFRVFRDWDQSAATKEFNVEVNALEENLVWDVDNWDEGVWASVGQFDIYEKGSTLGLARSVQVEIQGPTNKTQWGLDHLAFGYVPKRVR